MIKTFLIVFIISFLLLHSFYGVYSYFKSIYRSIRLTWNDSHDYFFKLMYYLFKHKSTIVSCVVNYDNYLITVSDDNGITYFIDVNLTDNKFKMRMSSTFVNCFIFGEDLNSDDTGKLNKLVEFSIFKDKRRRNLDDFEIETYKKIYQ